MQKRLLLLLGLILQGCSYSDGCFYSPQMVSCVDKDEPFPAIAHYQKVNSIGKTNSEQRWKDATACGAEYGDIHLKKLPQANYESFKTCMGSKGYKRFWQAECGFQDPKWDKKVCNL